MRAADQINQSDKRAADYQTETVAILREANRYNEKLMRQIDQASSDVVDAEFSEAAE
jgi:hypothetical protein